MKRQDIISKLMNEGFTQKTLVSMTDKQLHTLAERIIGEQYLSTMTTTTNNPSVINIPKEKTQDIATAKARKQTFATYEGEVKEEKLGEEPKKEKIESEKVLQRIHHKAESKMKKGECIKSEVELLKRMKKNVPEKYEKYVASKTKKVEEPVSENKEMKKWVNKLVESKYFTSKNEIMELVHTKLSEQEVETETLPDFLTYDAITAAGAPTTKPAEPTTIPKTKPMPRTIPDPYKPGIKPSHRPKASMEEDQKVKTPSKTKPGKKINPYKPGIGPKHKPKA